VGVLGHFIEEEGIPTTGISLVRPHTETVKPPRALWVPFQMGHPLGAPDDPAFQKRVLKDVLSLLESPGSPPVLADFPEDEPENNEITVLSCQVNFARSTDETEDADPLLTALRREITAMRPWYDMAVNKRKRTTVGVSNIELEAIGDFIFAFVKGEEPDNPLKDTPLVYTLKYAVEDLKSYYIEGITAQPGQAGASSQLLQDWFWEETVAGKVLLALQKVCEASPDKLMSEIGSHFVVPGDVVRRHSG
jgi:hypothetical protein